MIVKRSGGYHVVSEVMKIAIIGTHCYIDKMVKHKEELEKEGHEVRLPVLDNHPVECKEIDICSNNLASIIWCDEVHIFWDQRSIGTMFDFGMVFALMKPIKIIYMESKTLKNLLEQYEKVMVNPNGGRKMKVGGEER